MNKIKLLSAVRALSAWARGEGSYLDVAWSLGISQESLLPLLVQNQLSDATGHVNEGVSEGEAVTCILLAMIVHERHERTRPLYPKPRR